MLQAVLTVDDVADLLRVSRHTVYRLAQRGELPGRKIGRIWRFPRRGVEQYLSGYQHGVTCDSDSPGHAEDVGTQEGSDLESTAQPAPREKNSQRMIGSGRPQSKTSE